MGTLKFSRRQKKTFLVVAIFLIFYHNEKKNGMTWNRMPLKDMWWHYSNIKNQHFRFERF